MRTVTRCPDCETQFFVTEVQLSKHNGKVRCGQCMHVFNATEHFIDPAAVATMSAAVEALKADIQPAATASDITNTTSLIPDNLPTDTTVDISDSGESDNSDSYTESKPEHISAENGWPAINNQILDDEPTPFHEAEQITISATNADIDAFTADASVSYHPHMTGSNLAVETNDRILVDSDDLADLGNSEHQQQAQNLNDITKLTFVADSQGDYFEDLAKNSTRSKSALQSTKSGSVKDRRWPWLLGSALLTVTILVQSVYYLRHDIATFYPKFKPYLVLACQQLNCRINLPRQIDLILIDDSDMHEDDKYAGLMHFSSSLINKADFIQAYPNIELTLTDTDDNPVLRRVFKPGDYLPANKDIPAGLQAGEHIRIKLALTTQDTPVAGYRVYITY